MYVQVLVFYIICLLTCFNIKIYLFSQKYLTCIPHEHKPFSQLSQLDNCTINPIVNVFVYERLKIPTRSVFKTLYYLFLQKTPWALNISLEPSSQELYILSGKTFCRKKMGELRKKFCWTIAFTKKMSLCNLVK